MTAPQPVAPAGVLASTSPLSAAMTWQGLVFVSGQVPRGIDGQLLGDTIEEQTRGALGRIKLILEAAGSDLQHVVRTTVYLTDISEFAGMNAAYAEVFGGHAPARTTVEVRLASPEFRVEIDAIAVVAD